VKDMLLRRWRQKKHVWAVLTCAVLAMGSAPGQAAGITDGEQGGSGGAHDKLSPSATSCAGVDPVSGKSKLIPCNITKASDLCQPNATSKVGACSVNAGQCRGVSETLTGTQVTQWNDGCGSTWNTVQSCSVSCPCVSSSNTQISESACGNLDQSNGSCGNGNKWVTYRDNCGTEWGRHEYCSAACQPSCYAIDVDYAGKSGHGKGYSGNYPQCALNEWNNQVVGRGRYADDDYASNKVWSILAPRASHGFNFDLVTGFNFDFDFVMDENWELLI
jgi:hypothetical protein